jgi:hypothetical protein
MRDFTRFLLWVCWATNLVLATGFAYTGPTVLFAACWACWCLCTIGLALAYREEP